MHTLLTANWQLTNKHMKTRTRIGILSAAALSLLGAGFTATVSAHSPVDDGGFAERIAAKFNLNKDEVQSFLKEERTLREAGRETKRAEHLKQLVTDGKLTQVQADAVTAKLAEMNAARLADMQSTKDLTREERRTQREAKRSEMDAWVKAQGIDPEILRSNGGMRGGDGFGGSPR